MDFKHPIPAAFNHANEQTAQFANIVPNMVLPAGHIFHGPTTTEGWNQPMMIQKGYTHYDITKASYELGNGGTYESTLPGRQYWSVPRVNDGFQMNSSTTQAQAEAFADTMPLQYTLVVLETMEGNNALPPNAIQWRWFHNRWKARCDAQTAIDGFIRYRCHNYFRFAGGIFALGYQSWELHRQLYTTPVQNWPSITYQDGFGLTQSAVNDYSEGQSLYATNLVVEGIYPNNPDADRDMLMRTLYSMDVARMQGHTPGYFVFGVREWRPNFLEGVDYAQEGADPAGRFMRKMKAKLGPDMLLTVGFLGHEFGKCGIEYGAIDYQPLDKKPVEYFAPVHTGTDYWKQQGSNDYTPFPFHNNTAGNGHYQFGGGDSMYFGTKLWNDTVGQVWQGTPVYLPYRINGGPWIEKAVSESDVVDAARDKRGLLRGRIHNGKMAVWYCNFYADHTKINIEFKHPALAGQTFFATAAGTGIHAGIINVGGVS